MSVLHNVRAFLGLSPQEGEDDTYHFGIKDDDTGAVYFDDDDDDDEVDDHDDVEVDVDVDEEDESNNTEESSTYEFNYESEEDASVEITFEDRSNEIRIVETERPKNRSKRSTRENRRSVSADAERRRGSSASKPLRAKPDPAMALQEARPKIVKPRSFADAQTVADGFKADIPIVMNLTSVDQELARRLIDFASGICYVAGGEMERIRSRVFLLTPHSAVLSPEDRRLLASRRYDR